ncbi:hypothetical protein EPN96_09940 [bacterium]|nr:MAG: hypothetical protein EPN96_09940 [bacterium]
MKMKQVCAWCCKTIEEGDSGAEITHGICQECFGYFSRDECETLQGFLDRLEAPVLLVDGNVSILGANRSALKFLKKEPPEIKGSLAGDVIECAYARHPEGCGKTLHCSGCVIRNTVTATNGDGRGRWRVEGYQELQGAAEAASIYVSTEKIGDVIFLKVETR